MADAPHDRYRLHLEVLSGNDFITPLIKEAGELRGWWTGNREWKRTYGRFNPDDEPFITLLFESAGPTQSICTAEFFNNQPPADNSAVRLESTLGWVRMTRFPADPALPGAARVLSSENATVVRYRPGRRCTIRVAQNGRALFAKVFPGPGGGQIHAESLALWDSARKHELQFEVAEPLTWDPDDHVLWQHKLDGVSLLHSLSAPDIAAWGEKVGRAAGSLARCRLRPQAVLDANTQLQRTRRDIAELVRRVPRLTKAAEQLLEQIIRLHNVALSRELRPIHGALRIDQCLDTGDRLGLLDFDRLSMGDPALDAATLLESIERREMPTGPFAEAFLTAYQSLAGKFDSATLLAYRCQQYLAKALRRSWSVKPDGHLRAEKIVSNALSLSRTEKQELNRNSFFI